MSGPTVSQKWAKNVLSPGNRLAQDHMTSWARLNNPTPMANQGLQISRRLPETIPQSSEQGLFAGPLAKEIGPSHVGAHGVSEMGQKRP